MIGIGIGLRRQRFAGSFADSYSSRVLADGGTIEALSCVASASTLLQSASLLLIPSGYKAGVAYSALPNNGNGDLTWTRNSTANRTNSSGVIESVGANVPRLSYMYGSCPSALLEPQRTNLNTHSTDFSVVQWSRINLTMNYNSIASPFDGYNGSTIILAVDASSVRHRLYQTVSVTAGLTYTHSIYAKKGDSTWIQLLFQTSGFDIGAWANFDLDTGTIGSTGGSVVTARMQSVGDGWYRCSITSTATITASTIAETLAINNTNGGRYPSYQNLTAQNYCYVIQAQLEVGAYPTTPIFTSGATATRLADTFTRSNIYTNGLIGASGGTWYLELKNNVAYVRDNASRMGITDNTSTFANALFLLAPPNGRLSLAKFIGGVFTTVYNTANDTLKLAIKWNGTSADVFANGVKVVSATAFTPTNMEFLHNSGIGAPAFIQAMALFNTPLSDTDCITLTT